MPPNKSTHRTQFNFAGLITAKSAIKAKQIRLEFTNSKDRMNRIYVESMSNH